ncbi:unnamed protein product [Closterium sp. NIES-64]|nr:unnamed protein product [Closterium sp. NIES-64]
MVKGRNNKGGKKAGNNALEEEGLDAPDLPVKDSTGAGKSPTRSTADTVVGPFEALLDLQNDNGSAEEAGGKNAEEEGAEAVKSTQPAMEGSSKEDVEKEDNDSENEEDASEPAHDEEDDGYLSDDSDEHLEPDSLSSVIALKRFSLTLLVPILRKAEVTRAAVTVAALLDEWKENLTSEVLQTTTYQELTATYFSGTRYGRLQVTFNNVRDANFVWSQAIRHECANGDFIDLTWMYPEDARFLRERILNPTAKEIVIKGVPADITAELIRCLLVVSKLVKHLLKRITKDPAIVLTSTGVMREEWVCVQTVCEKAQGNRFEQASAHIASARHKEGLKKEGSATHASVSSQKSLAFRKGYITKPTK